MKLDAHVHTQYSGMTTIAPLTRFVRESYNTPERVYRLAKARGMDLVAITDHDSIGGALTLADRPDVIVGCEVSAQFPGEPVAAHLGVLDITESQFREIDARRADVSRLLPYLRSEGIFTIINHVASQVNGRMTPAHIASLVPWVDAFEIRNGTRLRSQNATATALAAACGKSHIGGSDSHTTRGIGLTWTVVEGARCRAEFLDGLRAGRGRAEGRHGHFLTMASDMMRFTGRFYEEHGRRLIDEPLDLQSWSSAVGSLAGLPAVPITVLCAAGHFIAESRFNRSLVKTLVSKPAALATLPLSL